MRNILLLVVALLACSEETLTKKCQKICFMQISNAIPIQFWINGQETFNEAPECGLTEVCFCQPFDCNDEIAIQISDDTGNTFYLEIVDIESNQTHVIDFDTNGDIHSLSFIPSELSPSLCEKVIFKIKSTTYHTLFDYNLDNADQAFTTRAGLGQYYGVSPNGLGWTQTENKSYGGSTSPNGVWLYDGEDITFGGINNSVTEDSEELYQSFESISGQLKMSVESSSYLMSYNNTLEVTVYYRLYNDGVMVAEHTKVINSDGSSPDSGTLNETIDFGDVTADELRIYVAKTGGAATVWLFSNWRYTLLDLYIEDYEAAKSDCIDLRANHDCTKLIAYTSATNFSDNSTGAVIDYETGPAPTFYLRVPAQFWKEENPQTQQDLELSNGEIVTLRQSIQEKKLLELGYMPAYMHKKVQLALMHDTVMIDGTQWKRRDAYQAESIENYPLKKGSVLLTKYNSVTKNTI